MQDAEEQTREDVCRLRLCPPQSKEGQSGRKLQQGMYDPSDLFEPCLPESRMILKPFSVQRRGMRESIGGFSVQGKILEHQISKGYPGKEISSRISSDQNIDFVLYQCQFL